MIAMPRVSVIMPVFNADKYVAHAIRSILSQTFTEWELIVVNDGSTDNSEEVILSFNDPRIRYFTKENGGVSTARNCALKKARGEFICFVDADDALTPDSILGRLEVFDAKPHVNAVDGHVQVFNQDMTSVVRTWRPARSGHVTSRMLQLSSECFCSLTWMIRLDRHRMPLFDEQMTHAEDLLFLTCISTTGEYDFVNRTIYNYRLTPASAMKNIDGLARGYIQFYEKTVDLFADRMTLFGKLMLLMTIRKIVFLSYLDENKLIKGLRYLFIAK